MKTLLILACLVLSACGSAPGGAAIGGGSPQAAPVVAVDHVYRYDVDGNGMTFAMDIFTNFGSLTDQHELTLNGPTFTYTLPDASVVPYTPIAGKNTHATFSLNGGAGTLTITLYRDGDPVMTQSLTVVGSSVDFSLDI